MVNQEGDNYRLYSSEVLSFSSCNKVQEIVIYLIANLGDIPSQIEKYVKDAISKYVYEIDAMSKENWECINSICKR